MDPKNPIKIPSNIPLPNNESGYTNGETVVWYDQDDNQHVEVVNDDGDYDGSTSN